SRPEFCTLAKVRDEEEEDDFGKDRTATSLLVEAENAGLADRHWILDALRDAAAAEAPEKAIELLRRRLALHQDMLSAAMDAEPVDAEGAVPSESLERPEAQEPKKRRAKVRKKKVPQDVAPETAHPQAVDFESLHAMLAVRHQDLEQKLEAWMQRQEDMVLKLEKKLIRPHFGPAEEEDAEATSAPSKTPASEERPRTNSSFQSLKTMAKALTQRTDSLEEAPAKTAPVEMSPTQPVEAMNTEVDSPQVDINRVISAVAREGSHSKEKKKKNKIRNSKEVQDFYMEQMRRQMKRTRHVIISTEVTWQERLGNFMASPKFEIGMMLLSVTSAVVVGVEVNWFAHNLDANQPPEILTIINHVLTMLFGVELMMKALFSTLGINEEKAWKLFEILDEDNDGEIDADEFVSRCFKLKGSAQRVDTERIYACLKRQGSVLEEIAGYMNDVLRGITSLRLTLDMQKPQRPRSGLAKLASISAAQAAP
ncbi:unnamed protein product, partial [Effrenium voratum]